MRTDRLHPADDRLIALYFGDEGSGADERRTVRQHLHGCESCTWRYTELSAPLERLRRDAAGEADEVFTPARLDAQRARILERLDQSAAASRVIPFPTATARPDRPVVRRPLARWVAAAAAAGILIGVTGGQVFRTGVRPSVTPSPSARTVIAALPASDVVSDSPTSTMAIERDDGVLNEIDQAVFSHRITALSAIDEMTPHVRQEAVLARAVR
jgi:anti-sigma factor RsiW